MTLNDTTLIADLIRSGLAPELVQRVTEALVDVASKTQSPVRSANAERCARYRDRKAEGMSNHVKPCHDTVTTCQSSPPPSPLPLPPQTPPSPAPATAPTPVREAVVDSQNTGFALASEAEDQPKKSAKRQSKRDIIEAQVAEANAVPLPTKLDTEAFRAIWPEWCAYRTEMAQQNPTKPWTARAARMTLSECADHGPLKAAEALRKAINRSWQGPVWESFTSKPTSSHAINSNRTGLANAPGRYT